MFTMEKLEPENYFATINTAVVKTWPVDMGGSLRCIDTISYTVIDLCHDVHLMWLYPGFWISSYPESQSDLNVDTAHQWGLWHDYT